MRSWIRRSFKSRIFATILLVSLLPILLLDGVMLPLLIQKSEERLAVQADAQLQQAAALAQGLFETLLADVSALNASQWIARSLSGQWSDDRLVYQALYAAPQREGLQLAVYGADGVCRYALDPKAPMADLETDWGLLSEARRLGKMTVYRQEEQALWAAAPLGEGLGYAVMRLGESGLTSLFEPIVAQGGEVMLLTPLWRPIYVSQRPLGQANARALREQLFSGRPLAGTESGSLYYVTQEPCQGCYVVVQKAKIFTGSVISTFYYVSLAMGLLCLLLCLWGAWGLSRHLARPVGELASAMSRVAQGDWEARLPVARQDEWGRLNRCFNQMAEESHQNLLRSVARQKELSLAQLRMLQAQLNPHFLYNTLDTMKWLGITHQVPQVARLAADLAALLRASISGSELVTLEEELELVERYTEIQALRFQDRFTCEADVPENLRGCLVPKLVLQPLVENAILHGVGEMADGYIKLWAEKEENELAIHVSDNGRGMPPEILAALSGGPAAMPAGHLGLRNVDAIIRLHFGPAYGLSAQSSPGQGSCVTLRLPLRRKGDPVC